MIKKLSGTTFSSLILCVHTIKQSRKASQNLSNVIPSFMAEETKYIHSVVRKWFIDSELSLYFLNQYIKTQI